MRSALTRAIGPAAVTAGVAAAIVLVVNWVVPNFFSRDDTINEFLPYLSEMARLWTSGQLPILTSHSVNGGNLLIDFERSMFHPVIIGAALLYSVIGSPQAMALIMAIVGLWGVLLSSYTAAAVFGAGRLLRWFVAVALATGPLFFVLYLTSWWNASLAMAAFIWLLAALEWFVVRRGLLAAVLVAVAVLLHMLIGWPHGFIAIALLFVAYAVRIWLQARAAGERRWLLAPWPLVVAAALPLLIAVPLLSEYLTQGGNISRATGITNSNFGTPSVSQALNVLNPVGGDLWNIYGGYRWWPLPIGYVSLGLLLLVFVRDWRELLRRAEVAMLASVAGVFLLLSQLPSEFGPLRTQFRFLPYAAIFIALAAAVVLTRARFSFSRPRIVAGSLVVIVTGVYASWKVASPLGDLRYSFVMPVLVVLVSVAGLVLAARLRRVAAIALGLTLAGAVLMGLQVPKGLSDTYLGSSSYPDFDGARANSEKLPDGFIMSTAAYYTFGNQLLPEFAGARYLLLGDRVLNGYDPVGFTAYTDRLKPLAVQGHLPLTAVAALAVPAELDPEVCDLTVWGVRSVVLVADYEDEYEPMLEECGFERLAEGGDDSLWVDESRPMTGTASWASSGATITADEEQTDTREVVTVSNPGASAATVVFARIAWPGFTATADGAELPVGAYQGALVSVEVPAGFSGEVELSYFPRSWKWALPVSAAAAIGGILIIVVALLRSRTRRRTQSSGGADD
jgi:hypothetical protein